LVEYYNKMYKNTAKRYVKSMWEITYFFCI
jgi:hypothetical protein